MRRGGETQNEETENAMQNQEETAFTVLKDKIQGFGLPVEITKCWRARVSLGEGCPLRSL